MRCLQNIRLDSVFQNAVSACQKTTLDVKGNEEEATTAATFKTIEEKEIDKWARMTPRRKTTTVRPLRDSSEFLFSMLSCI